MRTHRFLAASLVLLTVGTWSVAQAGPGGCPARRPTRVAIVRTGGPAGEGEAVRGACAACDDWDACAAQLEEAGASVQVVALKNGVMYVYTTDLPARVHDVQKSLGRRIEHLNALTASGDKVRLCPVCRLMRGAAASGKLAREVLNIEGGCITVTTSTDPVIVAKLHERAGITGTAHPKP